MNVQELLDRAKAAKHEHLTWPIHEAKSIAREVYNTLKPKKKFLWDEVPEAVEAVDRKTDEIKKLAIKVYNLKDDSGIDYGEAYRDMSFKVIIFTEEILEDEGWGYNPKTCEWENVHD